MTFHKHSFQCFDAVVEKPALTAGHNFALPYSCACTSICLDQLDRCSLCSESQVKPVTSKVIENHSASCYQTQSQHHQHKIKRPICLEGDPVHCVAHRHHNHHQYHTHRHRKRIVLVKNSNPSIQKTILLHCKPVHSLSVFMEDVSELMHCLIKKLYTLDGCKVDSVQSLLHGPSILVCVGQEPFHPLLLNSFQMNSTTKLPKLILKSQSSTCNEDQGNKKKVNFGLKSKKDILPGPFPNVKENTLNDNDVEKRVLINEDGSLSVEMKVRFRLLNKESLHCSTNIKKSSCTSDVCFPGHENVYYSHCGHSECWSEVESQSASEAEDIYISKLPSQKHSAHCQHCCTNCQEYNIWKSLKHIESARFTVASDEIKRKQQSLDSIHNISCDEYMEQVVEKAIIQHTVGEEEEGDYTVQYCTISRCSSRSEACSVFTKTAGYADNHNDKNKSSYAIGGHENPVSSKNINEDSMSVEITQVFIKDERPVSVETNSSDILAFLEEDENTEENDVSPSHSRASQKYKEKAEQMPSTVESPCALLPCKPPGSPNHSVSTRTSSIASRCSVKYNNSRTTGVKEIQANVLTTTNKGQNEELTDVAIENGTIKEKLKSKDVLEENDVLVGMTVCDNTSAISKQSTVSELQANRCVDQTEEGMICVLSNLSRSSQLSHLETDELEYQREYSSPSIMSVKSSISEASLGKVQSAESLSAWSTKTNISIRSMTSKISEGIPADMLIERVPSNTSVKTDISVNPESSNVLDVNLHHSEPIDASSANSNIASLRLNKLEHSTVVTENADVLKEERLGRTPSVISSNSSASAKSTNSKLGDENDNDSFAERTEQFQDKSIPSVIPSNPRKSELQENCKTLENMLAKSGNFKANLEGQTPQSKSTKLPPIRKSKKLGSEKLETGTEEKEKRPLRTTSSISGVNIKSEFQETEQECVHTRNASIRTNISVKTNKLVVADAPCENEKEEIEKIGRKSQNVLTVKAYKSRKSKASWDSRPDTGNKDIRERTPSMSCLSDGSNFEPGEVANPGTTENLLKQTESTYECRPASASSSESKISSLSIKSKDPFMEKTHTSMSAKSNVSTKSFTKSKKDEGAPILTSPISKNFAKQSKKAEVSPAEVQDTATESAMSGKSKVSKTSKNAYEKKSPSAMSTKSNITVRSRISDAQSMEKIYRAPSHMTDKSSKSVNMNILALADEKTDTVELNKRSKSAMPGLKMLMTEVSNNADIKERTSSALSNKSYSSSVQPTSESVCASVSIGIVEDFNDNHEENNSVSFSSENSPQLCSKYSIETIETENKHHIQTPEDIADNLLNKGTILSDKSKRSECNHKSSPQPVTDNEVANNTKSSSRSVSSRSAYLDAELSKTKDPPELNDTTKSNTTNTPMYLKVCEKHSKATASKRSKSQLSSDRYTKKKEEKSRPHSADVPIGSDFKQQPKAAVFSLFICNNNFPLNENTKNSNSNGDVNISGRTCNESFVATDASRNIDDNKSDRNSISSYKHNRRSLAPRNNDLSELVPSTLPSSSPTEVVNEWLKKIPHDSPLYDVEDEFHCEDEKALSQYESGNENERDSSAAMLRPENDEDVKGVMDNKCKLGYMKKTDKHHAVVENIQPCTFPDAPPSVHLMKILLRPKLEKCQSLLEVSPVYGRKLSILARGFLDSLVNYQLLDLDTNDVNGKAEKYNDLINMLQSLWLCDHHDTVSISNRGKFNDQQNFDEEFQVKSFQHVPINSSFQDPVKSSINESSLAFKSQTNTHRESFKVPTKIQESDKTENGIESKSDSATSDIAMQGHWTPEFMVDEKVFISDHEQDTHLESPLSEQLPHLAEKIFHGPDPVWVLNLLNNIEKQFMTHYVTAMAEIKVHWNLNNDEQLDAIMSKLKDEVQKRIQDSIKNELKKVQGHVRLPRPPKESIACESSTEKSEQRCRRLKVNLSQAIDPAIKAKIKEKDKEEVSDDLAEGTGCAEGEIVHKDSETEENMTLEAQKVKQEVAKEEFPDGKEIEVELDKKTENQKVKNKTISSKMSIGVNQTTGELTAIESVLKKAEWGDYETEKEEDTTAEEEEDKTNEKHVTAEAEKFKCTDNKKQIANSEFYLKEKISKPTEDGAKTDQESVEEDNLINNESAELSEKDSDELDVGGNTIKFKTAVDAESAGSKTYKFRGNSYDDSSNKKEIIHVRTEEFADVKKADIGRMSEGTASSDDDCENNNDFKQAQTAEYTTDDDNAEYGKTTKDGTTEDMSDSDEVNDNGNEGKSQIAEERDRDDDDGEISETPETNETKTPDHEETHNDIISVEEETAGAVVKEDKDIAEEDEEKIELAEEKKQISANKQVNYETVQETDMDTSHSEEDSETQDANIDNENKSEGGTEKDGETPNDNMADESTTDGETSNNMTNDKNSQASDIEVDDKTTGAAETVGEQDNNRKADEQIRGNATVDNEATTGTDDAEDTKTAGTKTEGVWKMANNEITEDGDTVNEKETNDEELFEHEIAQNGETDCNKILVTDKEVHGDPKESNTDKDVFNTHNKITKPTSEMLHVNANTLSITTGESDEEGAEAEDETEPVETNGKVQAIKIPAMQLINKVLNKADIKKNSTVKMYQGCSGDGADADNEDSDTDLHKIYGGK